ncbi:MAG TPA: histidinol-phosphate transaminase [Opitutales bacterium]|nr:histidinol-phosphate transaminase [Opitutales bacterium]
MNNGKENWRAFDRALPQVRTMTAYVPGMQPEGGGWIKLNTNELPHHASPEVAPAVAAEVAKLRLYPNPVSQTLRDFLAEKHGVEPSQVFFGNGCDEVLALLTRVFAGTESCAAMSQPSYSLYPVLAQIQDAAMTKIPFGRDMILPVDAIRDCKANLFILTSPNAPTGVEFAYDDIRRAAAGFDGVFVIDETYADFASDNCIRMLKELPNVVITRSLSKSYGLAGIRAGYALASAEIISLMDRVRDSYNMNRLSQAGALAALRDEAYHERLIAGIKATREIFTAELRRRSFFVYESGGNFVFAEPASPTKKAGAATARSLYEFLRQNRILVRYFPDDALTESFLRISIGLPEDMQRLLEVIDSWQRNA